MDLFIASPDTWYGITTESWPYIKLPKHTLHFNTSSLFWFDLYVSEISFQKGNTNIPKCLETHFSGYEKCQKKCIPQMVSFLKNLPVCENFEDFKCIFEHWAYSAYPDYKLCLKPLKTTTYATDPVKLKKKRQPNSVDILIGFASNEKKIEEETLMIGPSTYIGSIGGSLGLFLGFSFFTYLSCLIDKLLDIC